MVIIIEFDFGYGAVNRYVVKDWAQVLTLCEFKPPFAASVKHVRVCTIPEF